jgi:predicted metal-dependent phosphoesterase TrpH
MRWGCGASPPVARFRADLHIHTCLSPCAEVRMSPKAVAEKAAERGIDIIGICDHNSAENAAAALRAARRVGVTAIAGMEVTTREEVHVVALFPSVVDAMVFQGVVYARLEGENDEDAFGLQVIANEDDEVLGFCERLLIGASTLSIEDAVARIHKLGGLAIASHIDREAFGIIGQLGFVPPDLPLDGLEMSARADAKRIEEARRQYPDLAIVQSSDAHSPDEVGSAWTEFDLPSPGFARLAEALAKQGGR